MRAPAWARLLLRLLAPRDRVDEVLGDLEEAHRSHLEKRGRVRAMLRTGLESVDMAFALLRDRVLIFSRLDFKLGFRMLVKYPGLTVVAGVAIAFAVGVGSGTVEFLTDFLYPTMPFDQGDRMVQLLNRDTETGGVDSRALHDFELWRREARSVVELGAFGVYWRNLVTDQGRGKPVQGAEMTAAAFGLPRVPPLLGRPLAESDEAPGAPEVAVIGYDLWRSTFGGDMEVVGKTVRLGPDHATIVGVMPRGFAYPQNQNVWTPFRLRALDYVRGESPGVFVVGRLAPGATLEEARAEMAAIGTRSAEEFPESHGPLKPDVLQLGRTSALSENWLTKGVYFGAFVAFALLMLLVCANVALLLFARTAARESEITVRTALGAARYQTAEIQAWDMGFQAEEYLSARVIKAPESMARRRGPAGEAELGSDGEVGRGPGEADQARAAGGMISEDPFRELRRRLANEPGISGVALASNVPGASHPLRRIQVEGPSAPAPSALGHRVATGWVDQDFFDVLGAPILSGRGFRASDLDPGQHVAIVNEDFAHFVLEDRNPIGRRFAYTDPNRTPEEEPGPWYEIVGVVRQMAMQIDPDLHSGAGIYHPLNPEDQAQVFLAMRVGADPTAASQRLHQVAMEVDPTLLLYDIRPMDEGAWETELLYGAWFWVVLAAGGIGLLLTLAGIYSIMAFTVSRRTREIGVRVALGADGRRVIAAVFSRALRQVGIGVGVGGLLLVAFVVAASGGAVRPDATEILIAVAYLVLMLGVCLLACVVPTRRALAIEPTEALRAEG